MKESNAVEEALWAQRRQTPLTIVLRALMALLLAFVTILIIQKSVDYLSGPSSYRIYVVGESEPDELRTALVEECSIEHELDGRPVEFVHKNHIAGDARHTAEDVAEQNDTLMVIGHFTSTASSQALPVYLAQTPEVPVLLTVETNPTLTNFGEGAARPVVQLWPDDDEQVETAVHVALQHGNRFWVVHDSTTNPVYSNYLANAFTTHVLSQGKRVVLRSDNRDLPSPQTLREYQIDVVFFPGGWEDALMLIHTVQDTWGEDPHVSTPKVLLTDAAADEQHRLGNVGQRQVAGTFVTHPVSASTYMDRGVQAEVAANACERVQHMVQEAAERIPAYKPRLLMVFNHHSLRYARQALGEVALETPEPEESFYVWRAMWKREIGKIAFEDRELPGSAKSAANLRLDES